jgi:hypothetical protein
MEGPATTALTLDERDAVAIDRLVDEVMVAWRTSREPYAIVDRARELAGALPKRFREVLGRLADGSSLPALVIPGVPLQPPPATPGHWSSAETTGTGGWGVRRPTPSKRAPNSASTTHILSAPR